MAEEVQEPPPPQQPGGEGEHPSPERWAAAEKTPPPPQGGHPLSSLTIWPPTQRTRDAVIHRLVETLSSPSVLSKRYGIVPLDEASAAARLIEEAAFSTASAAASEDAARADSIDGGIEIIQIYSKEISRRMLESVKARATPAASLPESGATTMEMTPPTAPTPTDVEEISSVESEAPAS